MGNEYGQLEDKKWEQSRELGTKLLIGLDFKLDLFSFSYFPIPGPISPLPFLRFNESDVNTSNLPNSTRKGRSEYKSSQLLL